MGVGTDDWRAEWYDWYTRHWDAKQVKRRFSEDQDLRPPLRGSPVSAAYRAYPCDLPPEAKLCVAILQQAIADLGQPEQCEAACAWFLADEDWLFSFENICDVLHLSASAVRRRLFE